MHRISALKKLNAKLQELKGQLKRMVHWDLAEVGSWLSSVYIGGGATITQSLGTRNG
jgi:hypothetical protein